MSEARVATPPSVKAPGVRYRRAFRLSARYWLNGMNRDVARPAILAA